MTKKICFISQLVTTQDIDLKTLSRVNKEPNNHQELKSENSGARLGQYGTRLGLYGSIVSNAFLSIAQTLYHAD